MRAIQLLFACVLCMAVFVAPAALAQDISICPRPAAGSMITTPPSFQSKNGILRVSFNYNTTVDAYGRTLFCFQTPDGRESPTLKVNPGDKIRIKLTDNVPPAPSDTSEHMTADASTVCGDTTMTVSSVNMHFHGMNISPKCHSDEVIHTLVNPGESFEYVLDIPKDEPPGLYWYHPHVHGMASSAVQGGATGLIEVGGIANVQPLVSGLPERDLVIRDQPLANPAAHSATGPRPPSLDLSLNYVPISYPAYQPAIIRMTADKQEFWRVANTSADTILDLRLKYDGKIQPLTMVGLDGVPIGSQDGTRIGKAQTAYDAFLPPGGRAEFIVTAPHTGAKNAIFETMRIETGPQGDSDPTRTLAKIESVSGATYLPTTETRSGPPSPQRFENLAAASVSAWRTLYFSEDNTRGKFYITVPGVKPVLFSPDNPPGITTNQGAVEDWTIQNRTHENHEFHIHQVHFLLIAVNGVPIPAEQQQYYDTYQVPFWVDGTPFPSITVKLDFRGAVAGDFVYHCHILDHEDAGMMGIVRVLPRP